MKVLNLSAFLFFILLAAGSVSAQSAQIGTEKAAQTIPAFAILSSHESTVAKELKALQARFTPAYRGFAGKQYELEITQREMAKLLTTPESRREQLNCYYGELLVRKIKNEAALLDLFSRYTLDAPLVRKATEELQETENELAKFSIK